MIKSKKKVESKKLVRPNKDIATFRVLDQDEVGSVSGGDGAAPPPPPPAASSEKIKRFNVEL